MWDDNRRALRLDLLTSSGLWAFEITPFIIFGLADRRVFRGIEQNITVMRPREIKCCIGARLVGSW